MINWKEIPLLRMLIPFLIGILLALHYDIRLSWLTYIIAIYVIILLIWWWRPVFKTRLAFGYAFQFFMLLAGYQTTINHQLLQAENYLANQTKKEAFFIGTIQETPQEKNWIRLILNTESAGTHLDTLQVSVGKLLVYIEKDSTSKDLSYGDKIILTGHPIRIEPPKNPAAFDSQAYYFKENIYHQVFIKKGKWELLKHAQGNPFYKKVIDWRLYFVEVLRTYLPKESDFSVASALILGYKNDINVEVKKAYATTGATHVLAVSGLHVGLIVWITLSLLNLVKSYGKTWRFLKVIILLIIIGIFVLITGAPPSVLRAALLFSIVFVGREYFRRVNIFNPLAASALVLLTYDPYLILDVGFQLSYLAMIGILYLQPRIYQRWIPNNKFVNYFWQLLSVSLAAQIATLPISLYYFHQIPLYFWLSGLIVIPGATIILVLGILLLITSFISTFLAGYIGIILGLVITIINSFIFFLENLPYNLIEGIWLGTTVIALLYFCLISFIITWQERSFKWMQAGLSALVIISIYQAYRNYQVYFQKQIVIYHAPKNSLIDCIDQRHSFALLSDNIKENEIGYTAKNYRQYAKIKNIKPIRFTQNEQVIEPIFQYNSNVLRFYNQQIIVIDRPLRKNKIQRISTEYVLLVNSPKVQINEITQHFDCQQIIFDASNKFWQVEQWKKECEELGLDCYDINEKGAWIKDIEL